MVPASEKVSRLARSSDAGEPRRILPTMDELLNEFLTESAESIGVLDLELVKLEQNPLKGVRTSAT